MWVVRKRRRPDKTVRSERYGGGPGSSAKRRSLLLQKSRIRIKPSRSTTTTVSATVHPSYCHLLLLLLTPPNPSAATAPASVSTEATSTSSLPFRPPSLLPPLFLSLYLTYPLVAAWQGVRDAGLCVCPTSSIDPRRVNRNSYNSPALKPEENVNPLKSEAYSTRCNDPVISSIDCARQMAGRASWPSAQ